MDPAATGLGSPLAGAILLNGAAVLGGGGAALGDAIAVVEQPFVPLSALRSAQNKRKTRLFRGEPPITWLPSRWTVYDTLHNGFVFKRLYAASIWRDDVSNCKTKVVGCAGEIQSGKDVICFYLLAMKRRKL